MIRFLKALGLTLGILVAFAILMGTMIALIDFLSANPFFVLGAFVIAAVICLFSACWEEVGR